MESILGRLGVLIVEDNPNMASIVKTMLKSFGVTRAYEAGTPQAGFDIVRKYGVDAVIVDYMLSAGIDGIEFAKWLRTDADSPNPEVPIIMLTGHSELKLVERARDAGVSEFCVKPIMPAALHNKLVQAIVHPRPFIRSATYFGPDRRRRTYAAYDGPERRATAATKSRAAESAAEGA